MARAIIVPKEDAKGKLNITLFAVRPDQEFAEKRRESWDNTWDNGTNYSDWGYQNVKYKDTAMIPGILGLKSAVRGMEEKKFGVVIKVRRDGFIYNDVNEAIFYADPEAVEVLETLKEKTVGEVRRERPDVAELLML